ncbi:Crp/Fnr family transcriptional regulator [Leptobacterium sp. I13]|uniref:Crp/Fnr family transcriptional regulator n=1 Tax=Leptobacterium meishanense TaxID=3128904 RepID=UPI0030EE3C4E
MFEKSSPDFTDAYNQLLTFHNDIIGPPMSKKEEEMLLDRAIPMTFEKKKVIVNIDQVCDMVYFINEGIIREYYLAEGKEQIMRFYTKNSYVYSFVSYVKQIPSKLIIDTLTECKVLAFKRKSIMELYEKSPIFIDFARRLNRESFIFSSEKVESFILQDAKTRYLEMLKNHPEIILLVPNYMIASYLGITPESLSRIKKSLCK